MTGEGEVPPPHPYGGAMDDLFFTTSGSETLLNQISTPDSLRRTLADGEKTLDVMAEMRRLTDEMAIPSVHGPIAGGRGDLKLVARVPEALLVVALAMEPDLLKNKKKLYKWLDANPHLYAYSRKKRLK